MPTSVRERSLGPEGQAYVLDELHRGFDLSQAVLPIVEVLGGDVIAFLPDSIDDADTRRWGKAIFTRLGEGGGEAAAKSEDATLDALRRGGSQLLVLETALQPELAERVPRPEHIYPRGQMIQGRTLVLWRQLEPTTPIDELVDFVSEQGMSDAAFGLDDERAVAALKAQDWASAARHVTAIVIPAYDFEALVMWRRTRE